MKNNYINADICFVDGKLKIRIPKETVDKLKDKVQNDRRSSTKR